MPHAEETGVVEGTTAANLIDRATVPGYDVCAVNLYEYDWMLLHNCDWARRC